MFECVLLILYVLYNKHNIMPQRSRKEGFGALETFFYYAFARGHRTTTDTQCFYGLALHWVVDNDYGKKSKKACWRQMVIMRNRLKSITLLYKTRTYVQNNPNFRRHYLGIYEAGFLDCRQKVMCVEGFILFTEGDGVTNFCYRNSMWGNEMYLSLLQIGNPSNSGGVTPKDCHCGSGCCLEARAEASG